MDIGALLLGVITLILALLDARKRTAPEREQQADEQELAGDLQNLDRALADGNAQAIAQAFERERRASIKLVPPGSHGNEK